MAGFLSRSVSITQFRMDDLPADVMATASQLLKQYAFRPIDDTPEMEAHGWVNFDDMLDTAWQNSPPQKGDLICFSLRIDKRRIPPAVLQKELRLALEEEKRRISEHGKTFISRERKRELKAQVTLRLAGKIPPTPLAVQIIWDTDQDVIYVASVNTAALETFSDYFCLTFGKRPQLMGLLPEKAFEAGKDTVSPADFAGNGQADKDPDGVLTILDKEWLTWLLFKTQTDSSVYALPGEKQIVAYVEQNVTTRAGFGEAKETARVAGALSPLKEAVVALSTGKKVVAATLRLESQNETFTVTLRADSQSLYSLRIPFAQRPKDEDDDPDADLLIRHYLISQACWYIDQLAAIYMKLRMDDSAWSREVCRMQEWIRNAVRD